MMRIPILAVLIAAIGWQAVAWCCDPTPLIPRSVLFGNPDRVRPRISPNGKQLAYVAPHDGVLNVWVRTLGSNDDRAVTSDSRQGIVTYYWTANGTQIVYIQDKNGDQNTHVYSVNVETQEVRDLTPFPGVQARLYAIEPGAPDEVLVGINQRDPQFHDVYRINVKTGESQLDVENVHRFVGWLADHQLHVRAAVRTTQNGGVELMVRDTLQDPWRTLTKWKPTEIVGSGPIAFMPDGQGLYITSSADSDTIELRTIDLKTGHEHTLASNEHVDIQRVLIHPETRTPQAVTYNKERVHWKLLDKSIRPDFQVLKKARRGDFIILDRDNTDRTWVVAHTTDNGPVSYSAYDRETKTSTPLFSDRKELEQYELARMTPIGFRARDGLTIHGYLTTPPGQRLKDLPLVVHVHTGPWTRHVWGYDGVAQWLANRGYAVLQVNFRGSMGYGKSFVNAGNLEWGGRMQDDLVDGIRWAVSKRIADPKRLAIFGYSYGGYAALAGLTYQPELFQCGISLAGPTDLTAYVQELPAYYDPIKHLYWARIGHPVDDAALLHARSPLFHVDNIVRPLLIGQGANDSIVRKTETLRFVDALRKAGKTVEYVEFPDEGHDLSQPENRLKFYAQAEKFLAKHLGGRFEE